MLNRNNKVKKYHTTSAADLLKEVMEYYEITQKDLAERIGTSQKNISDILNRKKYLNEVLATRIEKVTGISSKLLLSLDTNYKINLANKNIDNIGENHKSPLFLKRYSWVSL
ncbi:helix-turn-helix domain-containing protein [Ligilactobacillus faecis]|uniref:Helix-turn-helix domain-containing protein n=1 Tax=Ligilactobacillus faecis TaxID=762833 RepID=A0ABV4DQV8_9LACO